MAHGAERRSDLLVDALALIRQHRDQQRSGCAALRDELTQARSRVTELEHLLAGEEHGLEQAEAMYQAVESHLPPVGDSPRQNSAPPPKAQTSHEDCEQSAQSLSETPASLDDLKDDESNSLQDFIMTILATSDRAMHVDEVRETIDHIRVSGRTEKLGNSKRPIEDVRTALNRLVGKGRVRKVAAATYAVVREVPTALKAEAA
ncbi:hypothetical protein [Streptomyces sp. NBC_01022]|uniref:hypothetical protein n=1 Tax=Streptomyces sp. NBC_01022 TaxID=2903723 RepID=UPI002DD8A620|nr:hypothetical protein [Streptomyces sp. NBC_01022]WRZ82318.1 hypothetical protein OG316_19680 [Streptomyces sp. NBC_01022]